MKIGSKHRWMGTLALAAGISLPSFSVTAQTTGAVPASIRVLVGFAPGGGTDAVARIYAEGLREALKTSVVVENKPGAGGAIAAQTAAASPAGQPTLLFAIDHQPSILPHVMKNPGFDPEKDLVPLGRVVTYEMCMAVHAQVAARNVAEYAAAAKTDTALGNVAVPAPGSNAQFIAHAIGTQFGIKLVAVPYRGAAPAMADLAGGQIKAAVMPCDAFIQLARAGTVRIIGIAGDKRSSRLPDVPAMQEVGVRIPAANNFLGAYATRNTDPRLVALLTQTTKDLFSQQAFVDRLNATGMYANYASADELARLGREASAYWAAQVKSSGYAAE